MKKILLLFNREIKRYFSSPLAYIIMIVFLIISGWLFASTIFLINRITIENFTINVPLLLMFFAPALSMGLLAGEFHTGTMEVLGSLPIKDREIIFGKFLSAFFLLSLAIVLTLIYPVSISFFGNMDWGQAAGAYIGMILIGGTFLSAGVFASSVSSNQVVSFIVGFSISFALFMMGKILDFVPSYIRPVISYIGIDSHWENMSRGVIDIRDIIYFLSLWGFLFYASLIAFGKRVRIGLYSISSAGLVAGILIVFNILVGGAVLRIDLTENNIYSLSKASKKIAKELKDPVIIKAYFSNNLPARYKVRKKYLQDLLHEYKAYSDSKIRFEFIDPSENEEASREAMLNGIPPLQFTEAGKEKFEIKQGYMGLVMIHADRKEVIPVVEDVRGLEYDLTTNIKKITSEDTLTVGRLGDFNLAEKIEAGIKERYKYVEVVSTGTFAEEKVNSLIVRADENFTDEENRILEYAYSENIPIGIFADRYTVDMENFSSSVFENPVNSFLKQFGLEVDKGLLLDRQNRRVNITTKRGFFTIQNVVDYPFFPLLTDLDKDNPIVKDLDSLTLPFVSPLRIVKSTENFSVRELARTTGNSWINENPNYITPMRTYAPSGSRETGPFPAVAAVEKEGSPFRMMVCSNSRLVDSDFIVTPANVNFFLNTIDWLTQDYSLITIRSKGFETRPMKDVTPAKKTMVKYADILLMPLIVLGFGIYRWKTRELKYLKKKNSYFNG